MCQKCRERSKSRCHKKRKVKSICKVFYQDDKFEVPRGVKCLSVTLLGGGGGGGGSKTHELGGGGGGSGYLVSDYVLNVSKYDVLDIKVGNGGKGGNNTGSEGDNSSVKLDNNVVTAFGGKGGTNIDFPEKGGDGGDGYYGGGGGRNFFHNKSQFGKGGKGIASSFDGENNYRGNNNVGNGSSGGKGGGGGGGGGPGGGNGGNPGVVPTKGTDGLGSGGGGASNYSTSEPLQIGADGGSGYVKVTYVKYY